VNKALCGVTRNRVVRFEQVLGWLRLELWTPTTKPTPRFRDLHSFPGAQSDQISFELSHHREHVEQQPSDGVDPIMVEPPRR
jgi:hypothetical protein